MNDLMGKEFKRESPYGMSLWTDVIVGISYHKHYINGFQRVVPFITASTGRKYDLSEIRLVLPKEEITKAESRGDILSIYAQALDND